MFYQIFKLFKFLKISYVTVEGATTDKRYFA